MKYIRTSTFAFVLLFALSMHGAPSPPEADFNALVADITANSPEVKTRRAEIEITRLEAADQNALPDPEASFSHVWGAGGIGNKYNIEVSQSFDWPGVYRARSQAANAGTEAARMLYRSACLDIALQAKLKLIELVYLNQQLALLGKIKENTDSVKARVDEAYRQGELTVLDAKKMQIEQYKVNTDIAELTETAARLKADIRNLCPGFELNLEGVTAYPVEPLLSEDEYVAQIAELDPVIAAGKLSVRQENLNAKAARMSRLPGFSVGYIYQKEIGDMFNGFSVSMSLPFFQNRKARAVALVKAENAELSNIAAEAARVTDLRATMTQMRVHRKQIEDYRRVFGDDSYLSLLLMAYLGGEINVIDYLSEVNYFHETTKSYLNRTYLYHCALASLNRYFLLPL